MKRTLATAAACVLLFGAQAAASHRNPAVSGTVQYHTENRCPSRQFCKSASWM